MNLGCSYGWAPVERLENMWQLGRLNPQSLVLDADSDLLAAIALAQADANADPAMRAAILHGVGDQVLQALRKGREVANNFGELGLDLLLYDDLLRLN